MLQLQALSLASSHSDFQGKQFCDDMDRVCLHQTWEFAVFFVFLTQTGLQDLSRCVGIAKISLGVRSKQDLVVFLVEKFTFRSCLHPPRFRSGEIINLAASTAKAAQNQPSRLFRLPNFLRDA